MSEVNAIPTGGAAYNNEIVKPKPAVKVQNVVNTTIKPEISIDEKEQNENGKEAINGLAKSTVQQAVEAANESLKVNRTSARFKYHEATKQVSIKIVDDVTQEVIKEIPPEKAIEMVEKMLELTGILVDEKR